MLKLYKISSFIVIQNNKPVPKTINKLNSRNAANFGNAFNFSMLNTKLPHEENKTLLYKIANIFLMKKKIISLFWGTLDKEKSMVSPYKPVGKSSSKESRLHDSTYCTKFAIIYVCVSHCVCVKFF